jgi:hypothetical protein
MRFPLMAKLHRKKRMQILLDAIEHHEIGLRDCCAQLIELTTPDDELHLEIKRLLEALDR